MVGAPASYTLFLTHLTSPTSLRLSRLPHSPLLLFVLAGMFLCVPMAFFDLFRGALLGFSY